MLDQFDKNGRASFEIHVFDKRGREVGMYGPDGWFNKHGLTGRPDGVPESVEAQCKGQAVDWARRAGHIPPKGQANIKLNRWRKYLASIPFIGHMFEWFTPSPYRVCDKAPDYPGCEYM